MKFAVVFEASARDDLLAAFHWYEARQSGLGEEFLRSVAAVEEALARNPERYPLANAPYRSAKLRKFRTACTTELSGRKFPFFPVCIFVRALSAGQEISHVD